MVVMVCPALNSIAAGLLLALLLWGLFLFYAVLVDKVREIKPEGERRTMSEDSR